MLIQVAQVLPGNGEIAAIGHAQASFFGQLLEETKRLPILLLRLGELLRSLCSTPRLMETARQLMAKLRGRGGVVMQASQEVDGLIQVGCCFVRTAQIHARDA